MNASSGSPASTIGLGLGRDAVDGALLGRLVPAHHERDALRRDPDPPRERALPGIGQASLGGALALPTSAASHRRCSTSSKNAGDTSM